MKPAAIYARVSSSAQADNGTSLSTQVDACRAYAAQNGYMVVAEETEDMSGATLARPGLDRVRDLAREGHITAMLVYALDRLARETGDTLALLKEFKATGCELVTVSSPLEDSPSGKMLLTMLAAIAEFERSLIIERTRRGKERRARDGVYMRTVNVPYGYDYDERTRALVINEGQATWVRRMYELVAELHYSVVRVRLALMDAGATAPKGGRWGRSSVYRILKSELYTGTWHYNKERRGVNDRPRPLDVRQGKTQTVRKPREQWIAVPVPAIVSRELYERVQEQMRRNAASASRNTRHRYLLGGLIRCARCGCNFVVTIAKCRTVPSGKMGYYRCYRRIDRALREEGRCFTHAVRQDDFEGLVWTEVVRQLSDPEVIRAVRRRRRSGKSGLRAERDRVAAQHVDELRRELGGVEREHERLLDLYQAGEVDRVTWQRRVVDIRARAARLQGEMERALSASRSTSDPDADSTAGWEAAAAQLRHSPGEMPWEERRALLVGLGIRVFTDGETARIEGLPEVVSLPVPRRKKMPFRATEPGQNRSEGAA